MRNLKRIIAVATAGALMIVAVGTSPMTAEAAKKKNNARLKSSTLSMRVGKSKTIKVRKAPSKAKITYKSANKKIATVNSKGKVTGKKVGTTRITVTVKKSKYATKTLRCKITVTEPTKKTVTLKKSGKTTYNINVAPNVKNAYKKVKFTTSKKSVATVNSKGKVTFKKAGKAKISWTVKSSKTKNVKKGSITFTVKNPKATATPKPATPTPKPATPIPATPIPATPIPATPIPATPLPDPENNVTGAAIKSNVSTELGIDLANDLDDITSVTVTALDKEITVDGDILNLLLDWYEDKLTTVRTWEAVTSKTGTMNGKNYVITGEADSNIKLVTLEDGRTAIVKLTQDRVALTYDNESYVITIEGNNVVVKTTKENFTLGLDITTRPSL